MAQVTTAAAVVVKSRRCRLLIFISEAFVFGPYVSLLQMSFCCVSQFCVAEYVYEANRALSLTHFTKNFCRSFASGPEL